jgi:hypothetical protein
MNSSCSTLAHWRRALTGLACAWACASVCAAEAADVQIDLSLASDGALELAYTLPPGVTELSFLDGGAGHAVFRSQYLQAADACAQLEPTRMVLHEGPGCAQVLRWRVKPLLLNTNRQYEAAQPLSDGTLLADTGYYAAVATEHGLHWVLHAPTDGYAIAQGEVVRRNAHLRADARQVQSAQQQPCSSYPLAVATHHYVVLGRAPTERLGRVTLVRDPALDEARAQQIRQTLRESVERLTRAYGVAPPTPPVAVLSVADVDGWHGDTTAGNMMRLRLPRQTDASAAPGLDRFVAHETVHWWNAGIFGTDYSKPWLHEGHAEWAGLLLLREAGKLDDAAFTVQLQSNLNRCAMVRGETPAATLTRTSRDDVYACGLTVMALAQALHSRRNTDPALQGLGMLASLHQGTDALSEMRLIAWADGTAQGGTLHTLLSDESVGFASGLSQALAQLKVADAQPLRDIPAPLPREAGALLAGSLMQALMVRDCGGSVDFWTLPDRLRIGQRAACQNLRMGQDVLSVHQVPLFPDTLAAWNEAQQSCQTGQDLSLGYADGSHSVQPCPSTWPQLPLNRWIVPRQDALPLLGLTHLP